jgi:hypothetical protein
VSLLPLKAGSFAENTEIIGVFGIIRIVDTTRAIYHISFKSSRFSPQVFVSRMRGNCNLQLALIVLLISANSEEMTSKDFRGWILRQSFQARQQTVFISSIPGLIKNLDCSSYNG